MLEPSPPKNRKRSGHRQRSAKEIAHALHNVTATIASTVALLRKNHHSPLDKCLFDLLEHAAREAEDLSSLVATISVRGVVHTEETPHPLAEPAMGARRTVFRNELASAAEVLAIFPISSGSEESGATPPIEERPLEDAAAPAKSASAKNGHFDL